METQALYTMVSECVSIVKHRYQIELYEDFLRVIGSKGISRKRDFTEEELKDEIREARYEDVVSCITREGGSKPAIIFNGKFKMIKNGKESNTDIAMMFLNNREDYINTLEKIKELTPIYIP